MANAEIIALKEYRNSLLKIADSILNAMPSGLLCNLLTMARLVNDARREAKRISSTIERLLFPPIKTEDIPEIQTAPEEKQNGFVALLKGACTWVGKKLGLIKG